MTLEEQLKSIIFSRYKNVRAFATAVEIPYSTIDSIVNRPDGVSKAGIQKIFKIFSALNLSVESIATGTLTVRQPIVMPRASEITEEEEELLLAYRAATSEIRRIVDLTLEPYKHQMEVEKAM